MTSHSVIPATPALLEQVLNSLREDSQAEMAMADKSRIIREAFSRSKTFAGIVDGVPICVYGVVERGLLESAEIWLAVTPLVEKFSLRFLRENRVFVDWAVREYGVIGGVVKVENVRSQRWLRWLGFELKKEAEHSLLGRVYPFERRLY